MSIKNSSKRMQNNNKAVPEKIFAANGSIKGEINLQWDAVTKARHYILQAAVNNNGGWKHVDIISEPTYTISGLSPGKKYYFRIAPVFENGQGAWSEPAEKKAK